MNFEAFVKDIQENQWNVFGVEVYENGELTHSFGDTQENLHELYSATKTVLSIAVGIVYDMGLIDLDKSILEYLPKEKVAKMSAKQEETFWKITVKRLLTMSVADIPFRAEGDSWIDFALSCEISKHEEIAFNYTYIADALKILNSLTCRIALKGDLDPIDIREHEGATDYIYVVTPVRP